METETRMNLLNNITDYYLLALNHTDERTRDYWLVWNDPTAVLVLIAIYLFIITVGKKIMTYFPPVPVPSSFLFVYNFLLVILSIYMCEEIIVGVYQAKYDLLCAKLNKSTSKAEMKVTNALWLYFFSKAIEFLDTILMVLRKKFNQITFLHVFHHSSMLLIWWVVISWIPGGQAYFGACLNCIVHVLMYSYYGLSALPSMKNKLWWKKYITSFQLLQFVITFSHTVQGIVRSCEFPMWGQWLLAVYMIMMLALFTNFYVHEYIHSRSKDKSGRKSTKDVNNNYMPVKDKTHQNRPIVDRKKQN